MFTAARAMAIQQPKVLWSPRIFNDFQYSVSDEGLLAVQLGGVDVRPGGGAWLQSHMTSKHIWFTLLRVHPENGVDAIVKAKKVQIMHQITCNKFLLRALPESCHTDLYSIVL